MNTNKIWNYHQIVETPHFIGTTNISSGNKIIQEMK